MHYPQQGTYCGNVTFIKPFIILMLCILTLKVFYLFLQKKKKKATKQIQYLFFFSTALSAYQRYYSLQSDYWKVCICCFFFLKHNVVND